MKTSTMCFLSIPALVAGMVTLSGRNSSNPTNVSIGSQQVDGGADVTPYVDQILREGSSAAFLGVLVNVAKYRPPLLSSILMPLGSANLYLDMWRVSAPPY
jgi:hypothetical protein